jgi:hypothetical protein
MSEWRIPMSDKPPTLVDEVGMLAKSNVELFRGKQTVREMIRTQNEDLQRRFDRIEQRLDAIEKSL